MLWLLEQQDSLLSVDAIFTVRLASGNALLHRSY